MGTKYSTVTVTSYNASPPADDGSSSASNQITWAKHKTKLGDPLKTAVEAINTNLVTALNTSAVAKTDTYTVTAAENAKTIEVTTASAGTDIILLSSATAGDGFFVHVVNANGSTSALNIKAGSGDLLNGTTDGVVSLPVGAGVTLLNNAANSGWHFRSAHGISYLGNNGIVVKGASGASDGVVYNVTVPNKDITIRDAINNLTEDTNPDIDNDFLESWDTDSAGAKKVSIANIVGTTITSETSLTSEGVTITGIPSWARVIHVLLKDVSIDATDEVGIQLGSASAGVEVTGYVGTTSLLLSATASSNASDTSLMELTLSNGAVDNFTGVASIYKYSDTSYVMEGKLTRNNAHILWLSANAKTLDGVIDRIKVKTTGGTASFDAGTVKMVFVR